MTNWVYPLGTAADGTWDISIGTSDSSLTVDGWAHTGLKVSTLAAGAAVELPAADEERILHRDRGRHGLSPRRAAVRFRRSHGCALFRHRPRRKYQLGRRRPGGRG